MRAYQLFLACLFIIPACGSSADTIIPGNVVYLRNQSSQVLNFRILQGKNWSGELFLDSGGEIEIPQSQFVLTIQTDPDNSHSSEMPPDPNVSFPEDGQKYDSYYARRLKKDTRWCLCWSNSQNMWVADELNGPLCSE